MLKALRKVERVDETYLVYRVHDIIAKVKTDKMEELKEIIAHRIRRRDKVTSILTMTVIETQSAYYCYSSLAEQEAEHAHNLFSEIHASFKRE